MNVNELREEIESELLLLKETIDEIASILGRAIDNPPTRSDVTACATYLAQCYNGVENMFKRIAKYTNSAMPSGSFWHIELLEMFSVRRTSGDNLLPVLVDEGLFLRLTALRKVRHTVAHGYAIRFEWGTIEGLLREVPMIMDRLKARVRAFLDEESARKVGT